MKIRYLKNLAAALVSGLIFGVGLNLGGMTQTSRIVGVMDFFGTWDPTLIIVLVSAVGSYHLLYRMIIPRSAPLFAPKFDIPRRKDIDVRLVTGAGLFGVGWALSGFCPGPAVASLTSGQTETIVVVLSIAAGMLLFDLAPLVPRIFGAPPREAPEGSGE